MQTTYPLRLDSEEKRLFKAAARSAGVSLAEFLRRAAREKARPIKREAACLSYPDRIKVPPLARSNPKAFIRQKLKEKRERNR